MFLYLYQGHAHKKLTHDFQREGLVKVPRYLGGLCICAISIMVCDDILVS